ncbi:MAG: hypothetical protein ACRD28_11965 [Acidobacteriaceae bacterium]
MKNFVLAVIDTQVANRYPDAIIHWLSRSVLIRHSPALFCRALLAAKMPVANNASANL